MKWWGKKRQQSEQVLDSYFLYLDRPIKSSNVGWTRLMRMSLKRFEELSRVTILAMKTRLMPMQHTKTTH
jgi:hypothetical protein